MRSVVSELFPGDRGSFGGGRGSVRQRRDEEWGGGVQMWSSRSQIFYLTSTSPLHKRIPCKIKFDFKKTLMSIGLYRQPLKSL